MKKNTSYIWMILLAGGLFGCEENTIMPEFKKVGTVTSTVATLSASNAKPTSSQNITLTLNYVSPSQDPVSQVVLMVQVGAEAWTELESFNVQSEQKDLLLSQTVDYLVTQPKGTVIKFDMVVTSQKEFPMVRRTTITVQ
jgi:hypothetical protein